jgi:bla regulator protein BlaR1
MMHLMIATFSSGLWAAIGNHLWQCTLFAGVVLLLTILLRNNHARARHWLWIVASTKFLIPFSLLVSAGSYLGRSKPGATTPSGFPLMVQQIGRPFVVNANRSMPVASTVIERAAHFLPVFLFVVWICGCTATLMVWSLRWRRVWKAVRSGVPVESGREFEVLRRIEKSEGMAGKIGLVVSESTLEPGIVGIIRPLLLLPAGISDRLSDMELEAIIRHELCHVRRRDNLAAVVHMLVQAAFWFYPLVWWIGTRLVDERERACDEEVLRRGSEPRVYAQGILKVCEFYLESPPFCAAGVTGSNLKKRIESIMRNRIATNLGWRKKLLLVAMGALAVIGPLTIGVTSPKVTRAQIQSAGVPGLEVISIKPSRSSDDWGETFIKRDFPNSTLTVRNRSLRGLITEAYGLQDAQVTGGPDWVNTEHYDIVAKWPLQKGDARLPLQELLKDRFNLIAHNEMRDALVYELVVGKNGAKITEVHPVGGKGDQGKGWPPPVPGRPDTVRPLLLEGPPGHFEARQTSMEQLAGLLQGRFGRIVLDKTGLTGWYNFSLDWKADEGSPSNHPTPPSAESVASLMAALPEQLGLAVSAQTDPVEMLVIDSVERITGEQ